MCSILESENMEMNRKQKNAIPLTQGMIKVCKVRGDVRWGFCIREALLPDFKGGDVNSGASGCQPTTEYAASSVIKSTQKTAKIFR